LAGFDDVEQRDRTAQQIALRLVTPFGAEKRQLPVCLDAFSEDGGLKAVVERENGPDERIRLGAGRRLSHERTIELDLVEGKGAQRFEGGIAGSEVIERDADTKFLDPPPHCERALLVCEDRGFGQLNFKPRWLQACLLEDFLDQAR